MAKKYILFFAVLSIAFAFGIYWYNKPRRGVDGEKAAAEVQAVALHQAYQQDEVAANNKYLNKVVQVQGQVTDIVQSGDAWLLFLNQELEGGISCLIPGANIDTGKITKGTVVTVKGRCSGYNMDVNLTDCIIIQ